MMRRILLATFIICLALIQGISQTQVHLNIHHKLGEADFALNQASKNNMGHDFELVRLQYYISGMTLIHDGGVETPSGLRWILVDATEDITYDLGEMDVTNLEKIRFHVGVNPEANHLDPAMYDPTHPLAPQAPSMHWGWTAGYRFVAMEGWAGPDFNQDLQIHGLGDVNFFTTEFDISLTENNGTLTIDIDADYARALENMAINSGVIIHGEILQAKQCLENFSNYVYSPTMTTSSTLDFAGINQFEFYPNPIENGLSTLKLETEITKNSYGLAIMSMDGKLMQSFDSVNDGQVIDFSDFPGGMYIGNLIKDGKLIMSKKIVVK